MERTYAHQSIGVERHPNVLRAIAIEVKDNEILVDDFFDLPIKIGQADEEGVKPLYIAEKNKKFEFWLENDLVVSALAGDAVLVRPMDIKLTKQKEIDEVLYFQAEPLIPFPIETTVVDRIVVSKDKDGTALTLLAAPAEQIQSHLMELSQLNVDPEVVTCEQAALSAYLQAVTPNSDDAKILICLESDHTTCILNKRGKLVAGQTIPKGCKDVKMEAFSAEEKHNHELKDAFESLRQEIIRVVYALGKQLKGDELSGIVITGEGANWGTLGLELTAELHKPLLEPSVFRGITKEKQNIYAAPLGAALTTISNCPDQINFRQKEHRFQNPLKRYKKNLILYGLVALGLAAAAYISGGQYLGYREDLVRENYAELLSNIKRPFNEMEGAYLKKSPEDPSLVLNVKHLSMDDLSKRLDYLEKEVQNAPALFPLFPNVPRVSDLLAWLSNHSNVVVNKNGTLESLIQIESLTYTLVKRPEMNKKTERYQVKVELELMANSPKEAREFHDALISPNDMVDPKAEVKWNATKGRYRTSFFLKDRTLYPQIH